MRGRYDALAFRIEPAMDAIWYQLTPALPLTPALTLTLTLSSLLLGRVYIPAYA